MLEEQAAIKIRTQLSWIDFCRAYFRRVRLYADVISVILSSGPVRVNRYLSNCKYKLVVDNIVDDGSKHDSDQRGEQVVHPLRNQKREEELIEQDCTDPGGMKADPLKEHMTFAITPIKKLVTDEIQLDTDDRLNEIREILIKTAIMDQNVKYDNAYKHYKNAYKAKAKEASP